MPTARMAKVLASTSNDDLTPSFSDLVPEMKPFTSRTLPTMALALPFARAAVDATEVIEDSAAPIRLLRVVTSVVEALPASPSVTVWRMDVSCAASEGDPFLAVVTSDESVATDVDEALPRMSLSAVFRRVF
ncbi:hypothetical protein D3C80_1362690 [compost metagenome]